MEIEIQPIEPYQTQEVKRLILSVAQGIYGWPEPLDGVIRRFDEKGELRDVDDPWLHYFDRRGLFLVAVDRGHVIGTGAVRQVDEQTAEIKRLWLLERYQGRGIGYRLVQKLFDFARSTGYQRIILQTDIRSTRARRFYQRLGFTIIPCQSDDPEDICMEMAL